MIWALVITLATSTGDTSARLSDHPNIHTCAIAADRHLAQTGEPAMCEPRRKK